MLEKYNEISSYIKDTIEGLAGFENFTVYIGDPIQNPVRPYARISLDSLQSEFLGVTNAQKLVTSRIKVGVETIYQDEQTFLANIQQLLSAIEENYIICGVEFFYISEIVFSSEDNSLSRCTMTFEAQYYSGF